MLTRSGVHDEVRTGIDMQVDAGLAMGFSTGACRSRVTGAKTAAWAESSPVRARERHVVHVHEDVLVERVCSHGGQIDEPPRRPL